MPGVASFHLVRERHALVSLARLGTDRLALRRVDGLRFVRLLGTGAGADTGPGADLRRSAVFAVWEDDDAVDAFEARQRARWQRSTEVWSVRMRAAGGHGRWRGVDVLGLVEHADPGDGPVAVVTRADVRVRAWRPFRAAGPAVSGEVATADGLLGVVGVGEIPVGRLGTFSLWRDLASMRAFAAAPRHRDVVARTRAERWYGEELFARFVPYASSGAWDGRDPLRGRPTGGAPLDGDAAPAGEPDGDPATDGG